MPASSAATCAGVSGRVISRSTTSPAKPGVSSLIVTDIVWLSPLFRGDRGRLFGGHPGALGRGAAQVPHVLQVAVAPSAVHRGAVVPHHQVADAPLMGMHEPRL